MRIEKRVEKLERASLTSNNGVNLLFVSFASPEVPEGPLAFAVVTGLDKRLNRQDQETEAEFAQRVCSEFVDYHRLTTRAEHLLSQEDFDALRASKDAEFALGLAKSSGVPQDGSAEHSIGRSDEDE
ncbi:MAG: hypothetical protein AAFZ99_06590 [Pseudomonadota bacterium]